MKQDISIDEAMKKANNKILYPAILIAILLSVGVIVIANYYLDKGHFDGYIILSIIISLVIAYIYFRIYFFKWKIWAFTNVKNIHALQRRAKLGGLLLNPDIFSTREKSKSKYAQQIKDIQSRLREDEFFIDDYSVPTETIVYYSKYKTFLPILATIIVLIFIIDFLLNEGLSILISIVLVACVFFVYSSFSDFKNKAPQIIINDKGLATASTIFYEWKKIKEIEIIVEYRYKNNYTYLRYKHPKGKGNLDISSYNIRAAKLDYLITVYRGRYINNQSLTYGNPIPAPQKHL